MAEKYLNLKEQFRYLVEHGISDYGNTVGEACDKAYDIMISKLLAVRELVHSLEEEEE